MTQAMTSGTGVALGTIGQIAVTVTELDRAVAFYRDTLGMRFLFQAPPQMAFFDCGGVRLLLGVNESGATDHGSSIIYYKVDDIIAATAALTARGVTFTEPPRMIARMPDHELWLASFHDSEGNVLALMSEVREKK